MEKCINSSTDSWEVAVFVLVIVTNTSDSFYVISFHEIKCINRGII